tara:strand:+ start:1060 stop:1293 length:234 start_codon:yes stop_codon:yes gene_type:complete
MSTIKKVSRFVISKNGIKNNITNEFINKKGEKFIYNQSIIFKQLKDKFENMNCWNKYKTYTSTNNLPKFVRELQSLV